MRNAAVEMLHLSLTKRDQKVREQTRLSQLLSAVFGRWNRPELTSVLVVDDDARVRTLMRGRLEIAGYRVDEAPNGEVALDMYRDAPTDVVVTDIVMPEMDGREFISLLRDQFADARIVAISGAIGHDIPELLRDGQRRGALQTLQKPFTSRQMLEAVQAALT